jgi:hypothetical protein
MAAWLLRAVIAENVFVRRKQDTLQVPAGPQFRLAREIKNVVVALAKTCHYWIGHLSPAEQANAGGLLLSAEASAEVLEPSSRPVCLASVEQYRSLAHKMGHAIEQTTGLPVAPNPILGWVGVQFPDEVTAAWFVRATIAENILARRESEILYLPVPAPKQEIDSFKAVERLARIHRLWALHRRGSSS